MLVSPPSEDPLTLYDFKQEAITSSWFQIPSVALSKDQRKSALTESVKAAEISVKDTLGFQSNFRDFSHVECVKEFLGTHFNNGGNPFGPGYAGFVTLWMERNVLDYYASLWHAKWPHDPKDPQTYWGYTLIVSQARPSHSAAFSSFRINTRGEGLAHCLCLVWIHDCVTFRYMTFNCVM